MHIHKVKNSRALGMLLDIKILILKGVGWWVCKSLDKTHGHTLFSILLVFKEFIRVHSQKVGFKV